MVRDQAKNKRLRLLVFASIIITIVFTTGLTNLNVSGKNSLNKYKKCIR